MMPIMDFAFEQGTKAIKQFIHQLSIGVLRQVVPAVKLAMIDGMEMTEGEREGGRVEGHKEGGEGGGGRAVERREI